MLMLQEKWQLLYFRDANHYSVHMIRKCDLSSLLKASLKLPSTYRKTDDRVIRDGASNLSSMVLNFL